MFAAGNTQGDVTSLMNFKQPLVAGHFRNLCLSALIVASGAIPLPASELEDIAPDTHDTASFRAYQRPRAFAKLLELSFYQDTVSLAMYDDSLVTAGLSEPAQMFASDTSAVRFSDSGVTALGRTLLWRNVRKISDSIAYGEDLDGGDRVTITMWTRPDRKETRPVDQNTRADDIITGESSYQLSGGEFVRGALLSWRGDVRIGAEVNRSVIALNGDVELDSGCVVRGSVIAVTGSVIVHAGASVYGRVYPAERDGVRLRRSRAGEKSKQDLEFLALFAYNRVDGFTPRIGWRLVDQDSSLPEVTITVGVGLASERDRAALTARQPLLRSQRLWLSGSYFKDLAPDDEHRIDRWQNTALALFGTWDVNNYLEAQGGTLGAGALVSSKITLSGEYFSQRIRTLRAHPRLWSIRGADDGFGDNFQHLSKSDNSLEIAQMDRQREAGLAFDAELKNAGSEEHTPERAFQYWGRAHARWVEKSFGSDIEYSRLWAEIALRARTTQWTLLDARVFAGASGATTPLYRQFYLGGYFWLRGYEMLEFHGADMWATALEYGLRLDPAGLKGITFWLAYDAGQVRNGPESSDQAVRQSVGAGLSLGRTVRIHLAQRLDRSGAEPRLSVEFAR